ncbi:MAG TPA: hypothetical protein V6D22_24175 [Candidatus Obscuribacterales bacterium]
MADPSHHAVSHEPDETHDDHGHGHGAHGSPSFETIPEDSGADGVLNLAAWLAFVVLLAFSTIMFTYAGHAAEANPAQPAPQEAR